ncbi:MAG: cell division protein ZapE [Steroidobacteraceae bacterium]
MHALYARAVAERGFREDPAQLAAVARLDDLRRRLLAARKSARSVPARAARKLLRVSSVAAPRGLYLWGGVGRGKTWLMDLFYQSLPFPERRRRHFHRFMHDVHSQLKSLRSRKAPLETVAARLADEACVLCFDELYVTDIADAMILGALFQGLTERGVALVITSNSPPHGLYEGGLQRERFLPAIALLQRRTEVLAMESGVDYRLRQLARAGTYLASPDLSTRQRLEALFVELADGAGETGGALEINGRRIPVVRQNENVVWFDFAAICEGARSQNDYIEIARDYQSVLVSDVPAFDATRDDAARRFIALVDELYDRNVNLVVSAAAEPAALYRGQRLRAAFERTASRLTEMQSEEYLAREHRG